MVLGASSSSRSHGVDRFYNPPAVRRQLQQQQQQQQLLLQQQQQQQQKPPRTKPRPPPPAVPANPPAIDESRVESDDSPSKSAVTSTSNSSSLPPSAPPAGNLDRFLESTTPVVPTQFLSKRSLRGWRGPDGVELCPYFDLGDLWDSFREWSAYGAGVPLVLDGNDSVVQYYVPYLSGIQLYVDSSRPALRSRRPGEESDGDTYQDTSTETSSSNSQVGQEGNLGVDGEACNHPKGPIFEHLERDSPYAREPLSDKIAALATKFPGLKTYRSCDLLPSSWISVAWYPIYRIPTGHTLRDLDACFLTFHSLSTTSNNISSRHSIANGGSCSSRSVNGTFQMSGKLSLPVFGLASYKLKGSIWTSNSQHEQQLASSLLQAAENWLHLLQVDHPDFSFFLSRCNAPWR
ncbi:uncharacterized protein M6B38_335590 [Iris pallida]|uniref:Uncharacterized protein n=1 Tax=Iris pallida TaxID=29817 RepID=A0AAX6GZZ8_IRIPA|nr:uncharacterized protein M6B38_335590 [Iris pallida]